MNVRQYRDCSASSSRPCQQHWVVIDQSVKVGVRTGLNANSSHIFTRKFKRFGFIYELSKLQDSHMVIPPSKSNISMLIYIWRQSATSLSRQSWNSVIGPFVYPVSHSVFVFYYKHGRLWYCSDVPANMSAFFTTVTSDTNLKHTVWPPPSSASQREKVLPSF